MANNNRPISLLPAASKVCERVALNQFTQFMNAKKRLTEHQSGNKAMHSTETMNVMMIDQMLQAVDDKKLTIFVLLDFSKLKSLGTSSFTLDFVVTCKIGDNMYASAANTPPCVLYPMEYRKVQF